ncbi:MAG: hypothetical protein ACO22S_07305, partial [Burkholderiaceae bacterium]
MNGPAQFTPPSLPPLSAYRPAGCVPQCSPESLGLPAQAWQTGLGQLVPQGLGLACDPTPLDQAEWVSISSQA